MAKAHVWVFWIILMSILVISEMSIKPIESKIDVAIFEVRDLTFITKGEETLKISVFAAC